MNSPRISIVTPSYNQGKYLEETICSILDQGYPNLEYIIIDGGSSDESLGIIKKYEKYISYWCSEPDGGQYAALNKGFKKATGDIFAWLNSDDLYCPWTFRTVGSVFSQLPEVQWLTTLTRLHWDERGYCMEAAKIPGFSKSAFLNGINLPWDGTWPIQQESTFWRRNLWEKAGGINLDFQLAGDFYLWTQFFKSTNLYGLDSPLGGFRIHKHQRSHQVEQYRQEARRTLLTLRKELGWSEKLQASRLKNTEPDNSVIRFMNAAWRKLNSKKYIGKKVSRLVKAEGNLWGIEEDPFFD